MNKWLKPDPDFKKYLESAKPRLVDKLTPDVTIAFDKCDIPDESDFISIPDSNRRIMKGYLSLDGKPIVNTNYVQFHDLIKKVNAVTKKQYRMPHLQEITDTYYNSKSKEFVDSVKLQESPAEWTNEIIDVDNNQIIRDPINPRLVGNNFEFEGLRQKIKISKKNGYFKKVNEFGYAESVTDNKSKDNPLYLWISDGVHPVVRNWLSDDGCPAANVYWIASLSTSVLSARLVI